jgi:uncharacterized membrane protein YtjA (UPF0391 family)
MFNMVVTLLIIALIAAVLGFGGIAFAAAEIAKVVFLWLLCCSWCPCCSARSAGGGLSSEERRRTSRAAVVL